MRNLRCILFLSAILMAYHVYGQSVMTFDHLWKHILQYHPIAQTANIDYQIAEKAILQERGAFDPYLFASYYAKNFESKFYSQSTTTGIAIPTLIGANLKALRENIQGTRNSIELTEGTHWSVGLEMPLLKGLIYDQRRASLDAAQSISQQSAHLRDLAINDLYLNVFYDYTQWAAAYLEQLLFRKFADNALIRLELIRNQYAQGDRAAIDTVEARLQWLSIDIEYRKSIQNTRLALILLSQHYWLSNATPAMIPDHYIPDTNAIFDLSHRVVRSVDIEQHPALLYYKYKLQVNDIDLKLKRQSIMPTLDLNAAILSRSWNMSENKYGLDANHKFSLDFKLPIPMRYARGAIAQAELKRTKTNLEWENKKWMIQTKFDEALSEYDLYRPLSASYDELVANYYRMLLNEKLLLELGESSIFMINSRENKWLESSLKRIELYLKLQRTYQKTRWAAGILR